MITFYNKNMKYNRLQEMKIFIRDRKTVRNEELLDKFSVSIQTLRRDLAALEEKGVITKVYGGVVFNETSPDPLRKVSSYEERSVSFAQEKEYIGRQAARMVSDGDVIFIDSGTTAYRMLHYMEDLKDIKVISHSLDVMNAVRDMPDITGICAGGTLLHSNGTFVIDTSFYPYNYNKAFIATVGISIAKDLTNTYVSEGYMKSHVISQSKKVYLVADHSKFGVIAYNHFAQLTNIDAVITDRRPDDQFMSIFESNHIEVYY